MKFLKSINELFTSDKTSESVVLDAQFRPHSLYHGANIDILIKNIPYRFTTQYKNFNGKVFIYISFHIMNQEEYIDLYSKKDYSDFDFIVNKNMTTYVLNSLPLFVDAYKKLLLSSGLNPIINGFFYDVEEKRRENIYKYYFVNRLGERLKDIYQDTFYFVELEDNIELKRFKL